jgi:hypothetical protein
MTSELSDNVHIDITNRTKAALPLGLNTALNYIGAAIRKLFILKLCYIHFINDV